MTTRKGLWLYVMAAVAVVAMTPTSVRADIQVSGNTFLDDYGELDATDNWVVCRPSDISQDMRDDFVQGTDSPAFDTSAKLVFLYQLANNGGGSDDVDTLIQDVLDHAYVTSWGYFSGWGFTDASTPVGITENMGLDTWPDGGALRTGGDPGFTEDTGYVDPSSVTLITQDGTDWVRWYFDPALEAETDVSSLLAFTSWVTNWNYLAELIHEPNCSWVGLDNPSTPEPATLGLVLAGLGSLLLRRRGRR